MADKPLGIIGVIRFVGWSRLQLYEALYFTADKVIVARTATGFRLKWGAVDAITGYYMAKQQEETMENLSVEEVLNSDENNFAIPYSQIEEIKLKGFLGVAKIKLAANGQKYGWDVRGIPHQDKYKISDVERILSPIFKEKLQAPDS